MTNRDISEINIIYNIKKGNSIRIFRHDFVENNKNICKMIIDNKEYEITKNYYIKSNNNNKLKIILKGINNVTNVNCMFDGCSSLSSLPDISKWNTNNITSMKSMFHGCSLLSSLPDISNWNTNNVTNMSYMFNECTGLSSLPDISKWNINNVTNMNSMFGGCFSLLSLPDISKWNTNNITNMSDMFFGCSKLKYSKKIRNKFKL